MWKRELTQKIALTYPVIQAPMAGGATTPELVAVVSNAGCLGSFAAGYLTPKEIRQGIKTIRELTSKPFAVNLFIPEDHHATPGQIKKSCRDINLCCDELNIEIEPVLQNYTQVFEEQIKILIEEYIPVFSFTFGSLAPEWISKFKINKTVLIGTATNVSEAHMLEDSGIDFIVAQGCEAGGHRGTFIGKEEDSLVGLFSLIPQLVDKIKVPIIAAGGIMDGRGIKAAFSLGADAVQMGTAFLSCAEAGIPMVFKQALLAQLQDNTVLTRAFSGKMARGLRNQFIERMEQKKTNILDYPIQNALTNIMRKKAKEQNNIDFMSMWAGQSAYLCRNTSVNELIKSLIHEAEVLG